MANRSQKPVLKSNPFTEMPRFEKVRRISVLRMEGALKPANTNQDDFPKNINFKRAFKFNLGNGDKGYVFIDRKMQFKLYSRKSGRMLGKYKLKCTSELYQYTDEKTNDLTGRKFYNRKDLGLTNHALHRAIKRNDAIITVGIRYAPNGNILPNEDKKYLGKLHRRNDYVIRDISVYMNVNEEDAFQRKFGDRIRVSSDPGLDRNFGNWSFYGGEYFC